jgi:2-dehydropantoate 2-reductase
VRNLIVGAGAVGQVYGHHLQEGGCEVHFFVREKYAAAARAGFRLYPLHAPHRGRAPVSFRPKGVLTTIEEVREIRWDQVWLAVPSPALREAWLPELVAATPGAVLVGLTPGVDDRALLLGLVPPERLAQGLISLISYQVPLPGESRFAEPGMAYWFPPLAPSPFEGPAPVVAQIVAALRRGGQPARATKGLTAQASLASALLMPLLLGLEREDWSWDRFRRSTALGLAIEGAREAQAVVTRHLQVRPPLWRGLLRPLALRAVMALAPRVVPLDLETYLAWHFTKVGAQTRMYVARYRELAQQQGHPTPALDALAADIPAIAPSAAAVAERVARGRL